MKVLVLTNMYPPHHLGGYELSCRDVVERWRMAGHEVRVLTTTMRVPGVVDPADERKQGVARDLHFYWRDHEMLSPHPLVRLRTERHNQAMLKRELADFMPDIVSVWHMGAMSIGLLTAIEERNLPMVLVVCDDWLLYGTTVDPWIRALDRRRGLGRLIRMMTGIPTTAPRLDGPVVSAFNSEWLRRRALERSRLPVSRSTVVYSGIEPTDFPVDRSQRSGWRWRLLCVGRQEERKGTHVAVRALAHLPVEATLSIVGPMDANYSAQLHTIADELGVADRISFEVVDRADLRRRYADADVFLFPITWDEPFGLVPIEAMACGTPVVTTGTGGSAEFLFDEKTCLLVPKDDPVALAAAVRRLATDEALRRRITAGGFRIAETMTVDRLANALEEWNAAAANRFRDGYPSDLTPPSAALQYEGPRPSTPDDERDGLRRF